jgi:hypothetical protein
MATWRADARYTRLVQEHGSALLRLAVMLTGNRHDAEDAVQDCSSVSPRRGRSPSRCPTSSVPSPTDASTSCVSAAMC